MKILLLCVHLGAKTFNLEISSCHLADYVKELYLSECSTCCTIIFPYSTNQIIVFWRPRCHCGRPCLNFLLVGNNIKSMIYNTQISDKNIAYKRCLKNEKVKILWDMKIQTDKITDNFHTGCSTS